MAVAKQLKAAMLARRASKGRRGKRTRPGPRQYIVADLQRARDRVAAVERRIDNDHTSNPNKGRAGLKRAQLELHLIESQFRLRGLRQSRFQMDDDGDLHEQILQIEAHIEELTDIIERCRKIILISKVAIAAGGISILATIIGAVGFDPTVLIGAIAAVI